MEWHVRAVLEKCGSLIELEEKNEREREKKDIRLI